MWYEVCKECQTLIENDEFEKAYDLLSKCDDGESTEIFHVYSAFACYELNKIDEAIGHWNKVLYYKPHSPLAHFNIASCYALKGDLLSCFKHYEYRLEYSYTSILYSQRFKDRHWDGKQKGDALFVYHEQGIGDLIQYVRFLSMAKPYFKTITVEALPSVAALMDEYLGVNSVIIRDNEPTPMTKIKCDYATSMASLPYLFGITKDTAKQGFPYIKSRVFNNDFASARPMTIEGDGLRIGVCWCGSPFHLHDKYRSAPLEDFSPLEKLNNVYNLSLQPSPFINMNFQNFQETANLIDQLDLVITVDTAVAHLAGAMNKPVWLLLRKRPDWRWGRHGDTTYWYDKMWVIREETTSIPDLLNNFIEERIKRQHICGNKRLMLK